MDDARIRHLTAEVLDKLGEREAPPAAGLEARVAALESAVAQIRQALGAPAGTTSAAAPASLTPTAVQVNVHPSLTLLNVSPGSGRCILEPDRPCSDSGQCRTLGH